MTECVSWELLIFLTCSIVWYSGNTVSKSTSENWVCFRPQITRWEDTHAVGSVRLNCSQNRDPAVKNRSVQRAEMSRCLPNFAPQDANKLSSIVVVFILLLFPVTRGEGGGGTKVKKSQIPKYVRTQKHHDFRKNSILFSHTQSSSS